MAHHTAFPHLFLSLADQCVLVSVQFDVVANCLVDQIAARTVLRGSQRIKRLDLFGNGTEADGFLGSHNTVTVPCIILYYKALSQGSITFLQRAAHPFLFTTLSPTNLGCPILRALCEGWDHASPLSLTLKTDHSGKL